MDDFSVFIRLFCFIGAFIMFYSCFFPVARLKDIENFLWCNLLVYGFLSVDVIYILFPVAMFITNIVTYNDDAGICEKILALLIMIFYFNKF